MSSSRDKIQQSLRDRDYRALFMEGGCHFYALVLNEQLGLPLFYACFPDRDELSHVFVMKGGVCYDYDGAKEWASVAKKYAGWCDEKPRPVTPEKIREELQKRSIADLEAQIVEIARTEFARRRCLYEQDQEVLLAVYEGQRAESLQHRQSLFNAYSLSLAGLMAIAAGVLAVSDLMVGLRVVIAAVVVVVCVSMFLLIHKQRAESEKAMQIMRRIESYLQLFESGALIPGESVLPPGFANPPVLKCGLTEGDWLQAGALILVSIGILREYVDNAN